MRTYNIPIFVPHRGCPFDCVFCNQKRITGTNNEVTPQTVDNTIKEYLKTINTEDAKIEVAFFGGSFTGIPMSEQTSLLSVAHKYIQMGKIHGIRLSTRPDYINREILDNLLKYGVTTIELGVQSMSDDVLLASGRGHTSKDVVNAVKKIREYPFTLGLQMMTGLPQDTFEKSIYTAEQIIKLQPELVRLYPTLTIKDTELERMYKNNLYTPQTVDEAVLLCKELLLKFEAANIKVIRLGLQSTDEISEGGSVVAGPLHSSFGELVQSAIYYDIISQKLKDVKDSDVFISVAKGEISKATGNRKMNLEKLKNEKNINAKILEDINLSKREVVINAVKKAPNAGL